MKTIQYSFILIFLVLVVSCGSNKTKNTDSTTPPLIGEWVSKASNGDAIGLQYISDDVIYHCTIVGKYTFGVHGKRVDKKIEWIDGKKDNYSYSNTSSESLSVGGTNYKKSNLPNNCNPFFNKEPSENLKYERATKPFGSWTFTFTIITTFDFNYHLGVVSSLKTADNEYNFLDKAVNFYIIGAYSPSLSHYSVLDTSDNFYTFTFTNNKFVSGCYYGSDYTCYSMTGVKNNNANFSSKNVQAQRKIYQEEKELNKNRLGNLNIQYSDRVEQLKRIKSLLISRKKAIGLPGESHRNVQLH